MSLPKIVIVYEAKERDGERYLIASRTVEEAMSDDDGPRIVGTYKQFNRRTLVKKVKVVKEGKVR